MLLEADLQSSRKANKELISQRNQARAQLEIALREKATELKYALAEQKAELEEKYGSDFNASMEEGMRDLTADYNVQLQRVRDQVWVLGWKAALMKVGVPEDDPAFRNPPKFPSSGSVASSSVIPSAPEVPPEAPPKADDVQEACPIAFHAALTDPISEAAPGLLRGLTAMLKQSPLELFLYFLHCILFFI